MTTNELRRSLNNNFDVGDNWPKTYEVDHETYANVCQFIFDMRVKSAEYDGFVPIAIGDHGGIMFKGTELLLKKT